MQSALGGVTWENRMYIIGATDGVETLINLSTITTVRCCSVHSRKSTDNPAIKFCFVAEDAVTWTFDSVEDRDAAWMRIKNLLNANIV